MVFDEVRVSPIAVLHEQRLGGDVLRDPMRISLSAVEGRNGRSAHRQVVDGTGEAILEETGWVDRGEQLFGGAYRSDWRRR
jgi:hypothetical protein